MLEVTLQFFWIKLQWISRVSVSLQLVIITSKYIKALFFGVSFVFISTLKLPFNHFSNFFPPCLSSSKLLSIPILNNFGNYFDFEFFLLSSAFLKARVLFELVRGTLLNSISFLKTDTRIFLEGLVIYLTILDSKLSFLKFIF